MSVQTSGTATPVIAAERSVTLQNATAANSNGTAITFAANDREVMIKTVGSTAVLNSILEVSFDSGANYENAFGEDLLAAGGIATLVNTIANPTTNRHRYRRPPGATNLRSRVGGFVSGSVTVTAIVLSGG